MSYDWDGQITLEEGTPEYYAAMDRRFFEGLVHVAHPDWPRRPPFHALEDFTALAGKQVLEIGCGLGSTATTLARCGCGLTAIDLTQRAVDQTSHRLRLAGLTARVLKMDAERMEFPDQSFDYIWSWGVIHHSSQTERIVGEMYRVLKPGGRLAVMVYHRHSTRYWITGVLRRGVFGLELLGKSPGEIQMSFTDGFLARHYSRSELRQLFRQFEVTELRTLDINDFAIPLRPLRDGLRRLLGPKRYWALVRRVEASFGWELFLKARKNGPV